MSMQSACQKELFSVDTLETTYGFIEYKIVGQECFIVTLYIKPNERGKGYYRVLLNNLVDLVKSRGVTSLVSELRLDIPEPETSMAMHLSYGAKLHSAYNNVIVWRKEI